PSLYDRPRGPRSLHPFPTRRSSDLVLLARLRRELGTDRRIDIISGFRSPATNAMLRKRSGGVARRSKHMDGMAVDIRIPGVPLTDRKSTRLNSSHVKISYAVFCLKK